MVPVILGCTAVSICILCTENFLDYSTYRRHIKEAIWIHREGKLNQDLGYNNVHDHWLDLL